MEYVNIPQVNKKVSRIFYGTSGQPMAMGGDANELLDSIYGLGVNAFDTARAYMLAEKSLGKWIEEKEIRDRIVILSKCGHPSPFGRKRVNEKDIRKDFRKSSDYLRTDYIDIYLLHRDDPSVPVGEIVEIFNALHAEGKIGAFGGSNWTHQRIQEANEYAYSHNLLPFTVSSPNFGLADQVQDPWGGGCISISGPGNEDARKWYQKNQMPVIAYSSLACGLFSGKISSDNPKEAIKLLGPNGMKGYGYPQNYERLRRCEQLAEKYNCSVSQIAMAYIYCQPLNCFAIVRTTSPKRMEENIAAMKIVLTKEEQEYLDLRRENLS